MTTPEIKFTSNAAIQLNALSEWFVAHAKQCQAEHDAYYKTISKWDRDAESGGNYVHTRGRVLASSVASALKAADDALAAAELAERNGVG